MEKSNNIGDSRGDKNQYGAFVVYTDQKDRLSKDERQSYVYRNSIRIDDSAGGPSGSEKVRRLTEEELALYNHTATAGVSNGYAQAPVGAQAGSGIEDEFAAWERQQNNNDLSGVFKPIDNK